MRLSVLLNRKVVSESGQQLGRVHDVRGELVGGRLQVTGLIAGKLGILERYGVATHGSGGPRQAKVHGHPVIPWERIVHVGSEIVIRARQLSPHADGRVIIDASLIVRVCADLSRGGALVVAHARAGHPACARTGCPRGHQASGRF